MIRSVMFWLTALVAGVALGAGSLVVVTDRVGGLQGVRNGAWTFNPLAGSEAADPYTRLGVALRGLLALNKSESIYFWLDADVEGAPLRAECVYEIEGRALAARWWSVTLYQGGYLIKNRDDAHSIDATRAVPDADGSWRAALGGPRPQEGLWISTTGGSDLTLLLRLYNPEPTLAAEPARAALPTVRRLSCPGGA